MTIALTRITSLSRTQYLVVTLGSGTEQRGGERGRMGAHHSAQPNTPAVSGPEGAEQHVCGQLGLHVCSDSRMICYDALMNSISYVCGLAFRIVVGVIDHFAGAQLMKECKQPCVVLSCDAYSPGGMMPCTGQQAMHGG